MNGDWKKLSVLLGVFGILIAMGVAYGQISTNTTAIANLQSWQQNVIDTLGRVDERTRRIELILNYKYYDAEK